MKITKEQLRPLIKMVLNEMAKRNTSNDSYEDYQIETDNLVIPGICEHGDDVLITITLEYNINRGTPGRLTGPPESSYPAEGDEVEIVSHYPTLVEVKNKTGQTEKYDDFTSWQPEQTQPLEVVIEEDLEKNKEAIDDMILDSDESDDGGFSDPRDEPEYGRDEF